MKYIKFIGNFKDLKPMGYIFQKLYASNYRCWHKSIGEYSSQTVWIWDKGKEVEIMDLYHLSYTVLEEVVLKGREGYRIAPRSKMFPKPSTCGRFILDTEECILHDKTRDWYLKFHDIYEKDDEEVEAFHKRYREVGVTDELTAFIQELYDKGMIEIAERPEND